MNKYYTTKQCAEKLDVTQRYIRQLLQEEKLVAIKCQCTKEAWLIPAESLNNFIKLRGK